MGKFCVFCGEDPDEKTKEHVVPRWLIEMTGDPKRKARFGFKIENGKLEHRMYAFDSFTFPACNECNSKHSKLESSAKPIVEKIIGNESITAEEMSLLLDWLDKVRVGVWLGNILLNRMHENNSLLKRVEPNFHIQNRIGKFDRALFIERFSNEKKISKILGYRVYHVFFNAKCICFNC